jgi:hypothetical protein
MGTPYRGREGLMGDMTRIVEAIERFALLQEYEMLGDAIPEAKHATPTDVVGDVGTMRGRRREIALELWGTERLTEPQRQEGQHGST